MKQLLLKPFLRILALLMYLPLLILSFLFSIVYMLVGLIVMLFSYIICGDAFAVDEWFCDNVIDFVPLTIWMNDRSIMRNYDDIVLDKIEEL